jgi:hypothetical protein
VRIYWLHLIQKEWLLSGNVLRVVESNSLPCENVVKNFFVNDTEGWSQHNFFHSESERNGKAVQVICKFHWFVFRINYSTYIRLLK